MVKRIILKILQRLFKTFGYDIKIIKTEAKSKECIDNKIRINIGAGDWECPGWKNLDYPSEWYSAGQNKHKFIPYDIRGDKLPFDDSTVDLIYSSHVVEHIEDEYIQKLFKEMYRVLKVGGGVRICCPDAEFLWDATKCNKDYWEWRDSTFRRADLYDITKTPRDIDKLVAEIAAPQYLYAVDGINKSWDYEDDFNNLDRDSFFELLTKELMFRPNRPGDHINWWTFDKMKKMLLDAGFKTIIRSKYHGSVFHEMKNEMKFDLVGPQMSLYVEAIK